MRITLVLAALLLSHTATALEQQAAASTSDLAMLYEQASSSNPRVLSAEAAARRAEHQQREALGQLLPQVNANARLTRTNYSNGVAETNYSGESYSASITQVLYNAPVWQSYQRSRAVREQYQAQGISDIQGATADLVQRYFAVLAAQDSLRLIQAEKRAVARNLERVNSLYERQLVSITEKLEVEARQDRLVADEIEADNQIWVAREALAELVGREVYERLERLVPNPALDEHFALESHEYWRDLALSNSPLIQAKAAAVEAQRRGQQEAFGAHKPSVNLQLSSQKSNIGYENSRSGRTESNVAAINIQVPLFAGGSTQARSDAAYESLVIARQELEAARREVLKEVRSAFMNSSAAQSKIKAAQVALRSATKAREAAEKGFSFGMNNAVDVLDRAREQYSAQRDLLEARYNFLLGFVILKRWAGVLSDEDIESLNGLLDDYQAEYAANDAMDRP